MSRWPNKVPTDKDELRKWHEIVKGVSWRIIGTTIPTIEVCQFGYTFTLNTVGCIPWSRAEARAMTYSATFRKGVENSGLKKPLDNRTKCRYTGRME